MYSEPGRACIVFAGCDEELSLPEDELRESAELVICADDGLRLCREAGMKAAIAVGDFDSASPETVDRARAEGTKIYQYPAEKDETDLEIALKIAFRMGIKRCFIFGGLGGRLDHEMANILLAKRYASMGMYVRLSGLKSSVCILTHEFPCRFEAMEGQSLSIVPLSDVVTGIRTGGLKYELRDESLVSGSGRGVSNVIISDEALISCVSGEAAIIASSVSHKA